MAINLAAKFSDKIAEAYSKESFIKGRLANNYNFTGAKTVQIATPVTVAPTDYTRSGSNRYGNPVEMQDVVQEMTLGYDRSFAITIDKGNNADQMGIKAASKMLALQIKEQMIPDYDTKCFAKLLANAGKINAVSTDISDSNIVDRIMAGTAHMDDELVPSDGRTLFINPTAFACLKTASEWIGIDSLGEKSLAKGIVGEFDGMAVVKVPAKRLGAGVNFIIVHKNAAEAPVKLDDTKLHQDPPGLSGNLLEGRSYFDCFVIGARCEGVYADVDSDSITVCAAPTQTTSGTTMTLASTTASATFIYTKDGSDPRFSKSAVATASTLTVASGDVIKAVAVKSGTIQSAVSSFTVA